MDVIWDDLGALNITCKTVLNLLEAIYLRLRRLTYRKIQ